MALATGGNIDNNLCCIDFTEKRTMEVVLEPDLQMSLEVNIENDAYNGICSHNNLLSAVLCAALYDFISAVFRRSEREFVSMISEIK